MHQPVKPNKQTLIALVIETCQLQFSVEEAIDRTLAELELDSLELMQLSIEIEDRFDLQINMENIHADTTLSALMDGILASND